MRQKKVKREKRVFSFVIAFIATLISFMMSLISLSGNITGFVVGGEGASYSIGVVFFVIGVLGTIVLLKIK